MGNGHVSTALAPGYVYGKIDMEIVWLFDLPCFLYENP